MHLPLAHLSGFEEEDASEELQGQLHATQSGSHSHSHSQGSKDGEGARAADAAGGRAAKELPCPRCQSLNTKFCYYNNYSVTQPRHFCRNCQRYWTVGGTLRNVPVGGGSRKKSARSRARADLYFRSDAPTPAPPADGDGHNPAMAAPDLGPYPDIPLHPAQLPSHGPPFPPFLDPSLLADEEAGMMAMMGSGMWVPELEPAHVELMHKAAMWAEAQRVQSMPQRVQAWADQERECKRVVRGGITPPASQVQQTPAVEDNVAHTSSLHRQPRFWETALMHSRPTKRPTGSSSSAWEGSNRSNASVDPHVDGEPAFGWWE